MRTDEPFRGLADAADVLPFLRRRPALKERVERIFGLTDVNRLLEAACLEAKGDPLVFADEMLRGGGIDFAPGTPAVSGVPRAGGTLVVANHPYGGADAIALLHYCRSARPDTLIFGNRMLNAVPTLRSCLLPLEIMSGEASQGNGVSIRRGVAHLRRGGLVVIFPGGEVSRFHWSSLSVHDAPWPPVLGAIVRLSRASVLPVAFAGRNSLLFQSLGLLHPDLRTAMIPSEFLRLRGKTLRLTVGEVLSHDALSGPDDAGITQSVRKLVDSLRRRGGK